jgi:hypothetical protein
VSFQFSTKCPDKIRFSTPVLRFQIPSIAHEAKYLKGCSITVDQVKAFIQFLERYRNNREYSIGGVRSYTDEAATKMITLKLRHTATGAELLRQADWTKSDGWLEWDARDIIKGLRESIEKTKLMDKNCE